MFKDKTCEVFDSTGIKLMSIKMKGKSFSTNIQTDLAYSSMTKVGNWEKTKTIEKAKKKKKKSCAFKCKRAEPKPDSRKKHPLQERGTKFAECFVCNQRGHLIKNYPQNTHDIYPKGSCCKICGGVIHLAKNCPDKGKQESVAANGPIGRSMRIEERPKGQVIKFISGDDIKERPSCIPIAILETKVKIVKLAKKSVKKRNKDARCEEADQSQPKKILNINNQLVDILIKAPLRDRFEDLKDKIGICIKRGKEECWKNASYDTIWKNSE